MLMGKLVSTRLPKKMALSLNRWFVRIFGIDISEAEKKIEEYDTLQELFIRKLKPEARFIEDEDVVSPADGCIIHGPITQGMLMQAKGRMYSLSGLVKDQELSDKFMGGFYATIYLSPKDYHRFHMPVCGQIKKTIYIPGNLWPVNRWAVANVPDLFCQNERVISLIENEFGLIAHIAVGATMVGKIDLEYCKIPHYKESKEQVVVHHGQDSSLKKGEELGKFMFGSTIILLFTPGMIDGFKKVSQAPIKMGESLAEFIKS